MNRRIALASIVIILASSTQPSAAAGKKPINYDAYNGWRSIQGTQISRDGIWVAYSLVPQDGDGEIVARNLKTDVEHRHPRGKDGVLTIDGKYLVFSIAPLKAELDKAKKDKKKSEDQPKSGLGIMSLATGEVFTSERVKSFKVPEEGTTHIAYLLEPAKKSTDKSAAEKKDPAAEKEGEKGAGKKEKKIEPGSTLIIRDLAAGVQATVPDVSEYVWTKDGSWLAYALASETPSKDGCFVRKAADGSTHSLLTGEGHYQGLAFDDKGGQLAFVSDRDEYKAKASPFKLYCWNSASDGAIELVSGTTSGMPAGTSVSENGKLEFSKDGARLFFGTASAPLPEPEDAPEPLKLDIWSSRDAQLQPMQKARAEEEKKRSYRALYHFKDKRFVQLASAEMPDLTLVDDGRRALGSSNVPYQMLVSWDSEYRDYYRVDLPTGARQKIIEKTHADPQRSASLSPAADYVVYFDDLDRNWYCVRLDDGKKTNLTGTLKVSFREEDWDSPGEPAPYGFGGWTEGERTVLLYDRYDIWEVRPDGTNARMITRGAGRRNKLVFRYARLDPEEKTIPVDRPLLLATTDDQTKATGFYSLTLKQDSEPAKVIMLDKAFSAGEGRGRSGMIKAKNADTLVYTLQRFDEFPDLWTSDSTFTAMKKISDANPQQAEFNWGKAELIDYRNSDGKDLRAILIKPEDFDPARKYPLMVYIYEQLTSGLHRYQAPAPGTSINVSRYVSHGYIVLQPDIVYDIGYPGQSALKCVLPAVQKVIDMGFVDSQRIGIQGHSWGGYQITYLITQTDMFRAVEAGASVSNMISAYGGIRWGTGMSRAFQYEKTQSRIGGPPWHRTLQFLENSPIFWVEKINTPYLTIHNDEDDAVPWYQGIEFISALRQLGKEAYMFNYNGEKHGLRERENQKHWTVHMDEFFDHYLKGAPRPEWMDKGVSYLERGKRDVRALYGELPPPTQDKPKK